jgi:uncharacterized cupredoxin-like copper-binding protein
VTVRGRPYLVAAVATLALTAASVTAVAATRGTSAPHWNRPGMMRGEPGAAGCQVPASLPGAKVTVVLADMGGDRPGGTSDGRVMGGRSMMRGSHMMLHADRLTVPAGRVSLVAVNRGTRTHELVVLPLAGGARVGARAVRADNRVDEAGSLGEASHACRSGAGSGITAGAAGWVTLALASGRYELVCNLPGHYAAGMHTELDVT